MKIVTFNIRRDFDTDGKNRFIYRKERILKKIKCENPDIICFQEVLPEVLEWLKREFPEYMMAGCGRGQSLGDEAAIVAFQKDKFDIVKMDTFWLSETPFIPGSRYENQSVCPRTCTMVLLKEVETGNVIRVYNTHLDHEGENARKRGLEQIFMQIKLNKLFPDAFMILAGDFNMLPEDPQMKWCFEKSELIDLTKGMKGTFHEFGKISNPEKIDYIFASKDFEVLKRGHWLEAENDEYLSDHYPLFVEIYTE